MKKFSLALLVTVAVIASAQTSTVELSEAKTMAVESSNTIGYPCFYYYATCVKNCKSDPDCTAGCREQYDACLRK